MNWIGRIAARLSQSRAARAAPTRQNTRRRSVLLEAMEPRLLLSADPVTSSAAGIYSVAFAGTDDAVAIHRVSTVASANGGFIVNLSYLNEAPAPTQVNVTLGDATTGVLDLTVDGGGGDDRFTTSASGLGIPLKIRGGAGTDTLVGPGVATAWAITGANIGSLATNTHFDDVENLTGGSGDDMFTLVGTGSISGQIDGGAGADTLVGPNLDSDWVLDGAGSGTIASGAAGAIAFARFESLRGGGDDDIFKLDPGGVVGTLTGGGGNDALVADNIENTWEIQGLNDGSLNGVVAFSLVENLIGGNADDTFIFGVGAAIAGVIDGGGEADHNGDGEITVDDLAVDSVDYSLFGAPVTVNIGTGKTTGTSGYSNIDAFTGGSAPAGDTIIGPAQASVVWTVSGSDEVSVTNVAFGSFENLTGANDNSDVFLIEGAGSISGTVNGGSGGSDGLVFLDPTDESVSRAFNPVVADSSGADSTGADRSGVATEFDKPISYLGLDRVDYFNAADPFNAVVTGTIFNDSIRVYADPGVAGGLKIAYAGDASKTITLDPQQVTLLQSLRIDAIEGSDTITVASLPANFSASLVLYGNRLQRGDLAYPNMPEDDPYPDAVVFSGDI